MMKSHSSLNFSFAQTARSFNSASKKFLAKKKSEKTLAHFKSLNAEIVNIDNFQELSSLILSTPADRFNDVNCSTAIQRLGKLISREGKHKLDGSAIQKLVSLSFSTRFPPRQTSNLCHGVAVGKLNIFDERLPQLLKKIFVDRNDYNLFEPKHFANIAWSFATLNIYNNQVFDIISYQIRKVPWNQLVPQDISMILWSFATNSRHDEVLFQDFSRKLLSTNLKKFSNQNISNIVWSFAKLGIEDIHLFRHVLSEIEVRKGFKTFDPQNISNITFSFAKLGLDDRLLFEFLKKELQSRGLKSFNNQNVANLLWSLARLNFKSKALLDVFTQDIKSKKIMRFQPQDVAQIFWSLAKLEISDQDLTNEIVRYINLNLKKFEVHSYPQVVWSLGKLNIVDEKLTEMLVFETHKNSENLSTQSISDFFEGLVMVKFNSIEKDYISFFKYLVKTFSAKLHQASSKNALLVAWSLAQLNLLKELESEFKSCFDQETRIANLKILTDDSSLILFNNFCTKWFQQFPNSTVPKLLLQITPPK